VVLGKMGVCRRLKLNTYLSLCTKINSKSIKVLNVRPKTLKLLEEKIEKTLQDIGTGNDFLIRILIAQEIKARTDKQKCIKFKTFCTAKETQSGDSSQNGRKSLSAIPLKGD
jgi:hypothetical protein